MILSVPGWVFLEISLNTPSEDGGFYWNVGSGPMDKKSLDFPHI
jgi:hypothetical protein